ncbi:hypothetical protein [Lentimicrobium sp.]|nr:hypothetical protein [Lentimicrobium sp.]
MGVIADKWGDFDVSGMQGSITDGGGYGFFMRFGSHGLAAGTAG